MNNKRKDDDDDINKEIRFREFHQSIFMQEIIAEAEERNIPKEEIKEILEAIGDTQFQMEALDNTFDKVLERYERGEITAFGKYFVTTLKREQRRIKYIQQQRKSKSDSTIAEFTMYNWLENE